MAALDQRSCYEKSLARSLLSLAAMTHTHSAHRAFLLLVASLIFRCGPEGEVAELQRYLARYGYLPNAELAAAHPGWRPIVDRSPASGVFDGPTSDALSELQ